MAMVARWARRPRARPRSRVRRFSLRGGLLRALFRPRPRGQARSPTCQIRPRACMQPLCLCASTPARCRCCPRCCLGSHGRPGACAPAPPRSCESLSSSALTLASPHTRTHTHHRHHHVTLGRGERRSAHGRRTGSHGGAAANGHHLGHRQHPDQGASARWRRSLRPQRACFVCLDGQSSLCSLQRDACVGGVRRCAACSTFADSMGIARWRAAITLYVPAGRPWLPAIHGSARQQANLFAASVSRLCLLLLAA